jgi:hypothetical protein
LFTFAESAGRQALAGDFAKADIDGDGDIIGELTT